MSKASYAVFQAKSEKRWADKAYAINDISITNIFNWKNATLKLNSPLTLITGKNGSGKSTFVNSLKHVYNLQNGHNEFGVLEPLDGYEIKIQNHYGQIITVENKTIIRNEFTLPPLKDFSFDLNNYIKFKYSSGQEMISYREILQQYDPISMDGNLLSIMKEIIDKPIISAEIIIDEENNHYVYYRLKLKDGTIYDTYTMGSGEYYINQFLWGISNLKEGEIVVIEELENYIHPEAQKKLLEIMQEAITTKRIQLLITTHSPTIIDYVKPSSRILLKYNNVNIIPINDCPNWLAKDCIGETISDLTSVLLEDSKAITFFDTMVSRVNPSLRKQLIYIDSEGYGNIQKSVKVIINLNTLKVIGIVDGDINIDENNYLIRLPGNEPPEKMIVTCAMNHYSTIAESINRPIEDVKEAFEKAILIEDYHGWLPKVSELLGENQDYLWVTLVKIWCNNNKSEVKKFYEKFYEKFVFANTAYQHI